MSVSLDLLSEFAKITNDNSQTKKENTVYGTVTKDVDGTVYVKIDGSELLTPVISTADATDGERVTVMIKNHSAIITGNVSSPAPRSADLEDTKAIVAQSVKTEDLEAERAEIDELLAKKLNSKDAALLYAKIDFSNIGKAAIEKFFASSGLIKDVVVGDASITGELVGVTIKGSLIQNGTIVADKLVIKGDDGLYYKLNTDGETTEAEQTEYNSINGNIITAKSITASKIDVSDLVAFDATIGGLNISESSLYSGVKETVDNATRGIYLDKDGQLAIGDSNNFVKFYEDEDGNYKLTIQAESFKSGNDNLFVGTRMFSGSKWINVDRNWEKMPFDQSLGFCEYGRRGAGEGLSQEVYVEEGETYTLSLYAKGDENAFAAIFTDMDNIATEPAYIDIGALTDEYVRYSATFVANTSGYIHPRLENKTSDSWVQIYGLKFEKGNKATEWCPSIEDEGIDYNDASKTASSYLGFNDDGLVVGDMTSDELGGNVRIDSDSVDIRIGEKVLATFTDSTVELMGDKIHLKPGQELTYEIDRFAVVTGTLSSSSGWSYFSYPEGYNQSNCTVLNLEINYEGSVWRSGIGMNATGDPTRLFVSHSVTDQIGVYTDSNDSGIVGQKVRISLMRID